MKTSLNLTVIFHFLRMMIVFFSADKKKNMLASNIKEHILFIACRPQILHLKSTLNFKETFKNSITFRRGAATTFGVHIFWYFKIRALVLRGSGTLQYLFKVYVCLDAFCCLNYLIGLSHNNPECRIHLWMSKSLVHTHHLFFFS